MDYLVGVLSFRFVWPAKTMVKMVPLLAITAILFTLDSSANAEDKVVVYKNAPTKSFPSYNEVPFDPSKSIDLLNDLLGLKSIQTLNYNLPTIQIPLVPSNNERPKPTSPPAHPLPPPPPAPKPHTTPPTQHSYPTVVPHRSPPVLYHIDSSSQHSHPRSLPASVEFKQLPERPANYDKPATRYVIVSRRPLPSTDDNVKELPPSSPANFPHPIPPPKRAPAVIYSGPPRVAEHQKYDLEEARSAQSGSSLQAGKPQLAQVVQSDGGPKYYLPQPTAGNEGYYGAFKHTPGSFDALLKSDLSFLDHLNYNPNTTEQSPQANTKEETHNSQSRELPSSGNGKSFKSDSEARDYYPPPSDSARPLPAPAIQSYSSNLPTSQSTEEKGQPFHKPVPSQEDKKDGTVGPILGEIPYGYLQPTKASKTGVEYPDIQGIYGIQGHSQAQPLPGYIVQRPTVVEYRQIQDHHNRGDQPNYKTQVHPHDASQQHQPSGNYRVEHPGTPNNYRPEGHLAQQLNFRPEIHNSQAAANFRPEGYPKQVAVNYAPESHQYQPATSYGTKDHSNYRIVSFNPDVHSNQPVANYRPQNYPTQSAANFRSEGHPANSAVSYESAGHPAGSAANYGPITHNQPPVASYSSEQDSRRTPSQYHAVGGGPRNFGDEGPYTQGQTNYKVESRPETSQASRYEHQTDRYQRRPNNHPDSQDYYDYQKEQPRGRSGLRYSPSKSSEESQKEEENEKRPIRAHDSDERDEGDHYYRNKERTHDPDDHRYPNSKASTRHHKEDYDDDDYEPFDDDDKRGHRRLKRQVATVTEKYQRSPNNPLVLKVFRAITVNGTDGVIVDERYVRDKDGKAVNVYARSQPLASTDLSAKDQTTTTTPEEKEGFATLTDISTEPSMKHEQKAQMSEEEEESNVPECAKNHSIPICTRDEEYPTEEINKALTQYNKFVRKLNGLSISSAKDDDAESNGPTRPLSEKRWTNICPSYISHVKPLRARNLKGQWKIIVNVDEVRQNLNIETCLTLGEKCNLVPLTYTTQCDQKYAVLHLLTYDPKDGLAVDQFLVPAACSCSMAKS